MATVESHVSSGWRAQGCSPREARAAVQSEGVRPGRDPASMGCPSTWIHNTCPSREGSMLTLWCLEWKELSEPFCSQPGGDPGKKMLTQTETAGTTKPGCWLRAGVTCPEKRLSQSCLLSCWRPAGPDDKNVSLLSVPHSADTHLHSSPQEPDLPSWLGVKRAGLQGTQDSSG